MSSHRLNDNIQKNSRHAFNDRISKTEAKANERQQKKLKRSKRLGVILSVIQLILSILFMGLLFYIDILPIEYSMVGIIILAILFCITFLSQSSKKLKTFGKVLAVIISILLASGSYYLLATAGMLDAITGYSTKTDKISLIVLDDDPAQEVEDLEFYGFGIMEKIDRTNTNKALADTEKVIGSNYDTYEYSDADSLVNALYNREVGVIIFNEAYRDSILENYETFDKDTRIITTYKYETKIKKTSGNVKITTEPFVVFLSGNDTYGSISDTGRSDTNILAVVNPTTKTVLLLSTPRDYYVELQGDEFPAGAYDKLTHAGIYGVDVSMNTLSALYDTDVNYYLRVNFTGFMDIIDALGGITIYNEVEFTSWDGYYYPSGTLDLDGKYALNFARERHAFALGDVQRGINQMKVIKAMADKASSPAVLSGYADIMSSVSDSFSTDMSSDEISSLVKMQLSGNNNWNIISYNVSGTNSSQTTYTVPSQYLSVVLPDEETVANAKLLITAVKNGDDITQEYADSLTNN
ncbi:MAG: LCP family protein [Eubacterium sp.]